MYEKFAGYSKEQKELLYHWEDILVEKNQKYQLEDYYNILKPLYDDRVQIDMVSNKLGQPSVRVRYEMSKLKVFDLFIFEDGLAVAYKPNGRIKLYEHITPKQAARICKVSIDWWMNK